MVYTLTENSVVLSPFAHQQVAYTCMYCTVYCESFAKKRLQCVDYCSNREKMFANLVIQLQCLVINKKYYKKMFVNAPRLSKNAKIFFCERFPIYGTSAFCSYY